MRSSATARRYARAIFGIAEETDRVDVVREDFARLAALIDESPELERALFQPLHPVAERRAVLAAVSDRIGSDRNVRNFYAFLIDQRRLVDFAAIREEYTLLADRAAGRMRAEVVSAAPLDDAQQERLRGAIKARTGKNVELDVAVDPTLIAGAVARFGDTVIDGSLRSQLEQLRTSLMRGH